MYCAILLHLYIEVSPAGNPIPGFVSAWDVFICHRIDVDAILMPTFFICARIDDIHKLPSLTRSLQFEWNPASARVLIAYRPIIVIIIPRIEICPTLRQLERNTHT